MTANPALNLNSAADYRKLVTLLLSPVTKLYQDDSSGISLGERNVCSHDNIVPLENFSRPLLGMAFIEDGIKTDLCLRMIKNGVNPKSPLYWGDLSDESQMIVELFPILFFCYRNSAAFNTVFPPEEKEQVSRWFCQINRVRCCNNNWCFFPILVNLFLKLMGMDYSEAAISENWKAIDKMYLGKGWYSDGKTKQIDYYNAFAFHFYSLLFACYSDDTERKDIILERARLFAESFIYFFSASGEATPFGRSLTYKFAQVAFWSIYSNYIEDESELSIIKGIVNRNLRWWISKDIFDDCDFLVNGYTYQNPFITEQYNGPGSPYWAFKAFFCLLNPQSKFFNVEESPLPVLNDNKHIPEAYLSIRRTQGHPFVFINGQKNDSFCGNVAKYEKFVYSSLFGFNVNRSDSNLSTMAPDSTLVAYLNGNPCIRRNTITIHNSDTVQISDWTPVQGVLIRSFVFIGAPWHIRVHYVLNDQYVELKDFGFACPEESLHIHSDIVTHNSGATSSVIHCAPCTNILYRDVWLPFVSEEFAPGRHLMVNYVYGNCTPMASEPTDVSIYIKNGHLIAFGSEYELPRTTFRQRLSRVRNVLA